MAAQDFEGLIRLYHGIFLCCGVAALFFMAAAVVLFVVLKIPRVFAELTGRVAKKALAQMSKENSTSGGLPPASRRIGEDGRCHRRGLTGALTTSRLRRKSASLSGSLEMSPMSENADELLQAKRQPGTSQWLPEEQLKPEAEWEIRAGAPCGGQPLLAENGASETTLLKSDDNSLKKDFVVLRSIMEIHTDEVI